MKRPWQVVPWERKSINPTMIVTFKSITSSQCLIIWIMLKIMFTLTWATSIEEFAVFTEEKVPARIRPTIKTGRL